MSFEDLPPNWTELPLSTPGLAGDVVDLVLSESLRAENTMLLLPCDERDVGYPTPVILGDTDWFVAEDKRREMLDALAGIDLPSVVLALSSPHRLPTEVVDKWHTDAQAAFSEVNTRLIGLFTAWPSTVNEVQTRGSAKA